MAFFSSYGNFDKAYDVRVSSGLTNTNTNTCPQTIATRVKKNQRQQRRIPVLLMTVSIAVMATLVSSALPVGPFLVQSAWALPYVSSVSVSPSSAEKTKGETATYTVTVSRASGSGSGEVNLSFNSNSIPSSAATF